MVSELRLLKLILAIMCVEPLGAFAQYAPAAEQPGSSAISSSATVIAAWSNSCVVTRGLQDISQPTLGLASSGSDFQATGAADMLPVSLGDGGSAVCTFASPISNMPGFDFAVFENGFDDSFLELAFVEVSSDGQHFFRFPAHSLTDTTTQTSSFGLTDPTHLNNLAGKYRGMFGTPFDLEELKNVTALDLNHVTQVRVVDVVGCLQSAYATHDAHGNKVNDPWPTAFPSSGFDLDAVAVLKPGTHTGLNSQSSTQMQIQNPLKSSAVLEWNSVYEIVVLDLQGKEILHESTTRLQVSSLNPGLYFFSITGQSQTLVQKVLIEN